MIRATLITLALSATPAFAESIKEQVQSQLQAQGFTSIEIQRTLLGRMRIVASDGTRRREIIINPITGEVLRDYWVELSDDDEDVSVVISPAGPDDDDDDDEDDDDDDEDDDDEDDD